MCEASGETNGEERRIVADDVGVGEGSKISGASYLGKVKKSEVTPKT